MYPKDIRLTSKQVRARYGDVSDMCLWRWLRSKDLNFPKPLEINRRRYWKLADLEAWEAERTARQTGVAA